VKFQALGSNYSGAWTLKQLFAIGNRDDHRQLTTMLEQRFDGKAYLYARGRYALAEAIRLACDNTDKPRVAVNALTCSVVIDAIHAAGALPLYIDVDSDTAHFSADSLESALDDQSSVCAVIVQNTYGRMIDIAPIETLAQTHHLTLIEDIAHSIGQSYPDGREAGMVGDLVMLSFGRDKLLDVTNGGALIIRNTSFMARVVAPTNWPNATTQLRDRIYPLLTWLVRHTYAIGLGKLIHFTMYLLKIAIRSAEGEIDTSQRLPNWQAKLALKRFAVLDQLNTRRRERMELYQAYLGESLISRDGTIRAALAVDNRTESLQRLRDAGYELVDTWYDTPIGPASKYKALAYPVDDCPRAVELSKRIINLPTHDQVNYHDIERIAQIVRQR